MSVPASEVGATTALDSITAPGSTAESPTTTVSSAAPASSSTTPVQGIAQTTSWNPITNATNALSSVESSISSGIGNWIMVGFGVILMIGAVLVSQKSTIVEVAAASA